jgi:hypothetical protein
VIADAIAHRPLSWTIFYLNNVLREITGIILAGLTGAVLISADPPITPLSVCEVLRDLSAEEGKNVAVLGRYSFREKGRWIGEETCTPAVDVPPQLWLVEDSTAPKPPGEFELNGGALQKKFVEVRRHTTLGKFRFGTPDYDRWAIIYGQVKARQGEDAKKAAANLIYRGSGVIIFLTPEE